MLWRIVLVCCALFVVTHACTSMVASSGASIDGSAFVTYNSDDYDHYGYLQFFPAAKNIPKGTMRQIHDCDSRQYLGEIPEAAETYNVVHYANEYGVSIGESTFGGISLLSTPYPGSIMDYGSLMTVALQRSKTARELINTMSELSMKYGYASNGESFSISDGNEAWIMEYMSRGTYELGSLFVAIRLPDGYVTAHANQARITKFNHTDPENVIFSPDLVDFARKVGLYSGSDQDFSYSDTFDPVSPVSARVCEARVWSLFQNITNNALDSYLDYARGWNLTVRLPLFVKPAAPLQLQDMFNLMKNNYKNTFFEFDNYDVDVAAGTFSAPYRPRGLTWSYKNKNYVNERPVATQQTFTNMVVQIRPNMPPSIGTILWFGVDGAMHTVRIPVYTGVKAIPRNYQFGIADVTVFSFDSAFWVFNMVANLAYNSFEYVDPEIQSAISAKYATFFAGVQKTDEIAMQKWQQGDIDGAANTMTAFSVTTGEQLVADWLLLWQRLFMKYFDLAIHTPVKGSWQPNVITQQVPQSTYRRVTAETGDHYLMPSTGSREKTLAKSVGM